MLDLSFGFSGPDVQNTFEALGDKGRAQYIYSSLVLDTVFPIIYGLLFLALLLKLQEERTFILSLPFMAVIFDLCENISISVMMSADMFKEISESQIFFSSAFNCFCNAFFCASRSPIASDIIVFVPFNTRR